MNRSKLHKTYLKRQSVVPSNFQKKSKAIATHIDKRRSVNTPNVTCKDFAQKGITSFPICKEKREKLKYEKSATKLNLEGLDFPDNFMAVMGWRRVKV